MLAMGLCVTAAILNAVRFANPPALRAAEVAAGPHVPNIAAFTAWTTTPVTTTFVTNSIMSLIVTPFLGLRSIATTPVMDHLVRRAPATHQSLSTLSGLASTLQTSQEG